MKLDSSTKTVLAKGATHGRALTDIVGDVYNVKNHGADPSYSATKNTTAFNEAIAAANAAGGGWVKIPAGNYRLNGFTMLSKVRVSGAGKLKTILTLDSGSNVDLMQGKSFSTLTGTNSTGGIYGWGLDNLTLDGNKSANSSGAGLRFFGYDFRIHDIIVHNCKDYGIWAEWQSTGANPAATDSDFVEAYLSHVKVHDCSNEGVVWAGPHDSTWHSLIAYNNGKGSGTSAPTGFGEGNIRVAGGGNSLLAVSCHAWGNLADYAWRIEGRAHLVNCTGEGGRTGQCLIIGSDSRIDGGEYFADTAWKSVKGILLGLSGQTVARTYVHGPSVRDCESGAIDFTYSNGQDIVDLHVTQTSGTTVRVGSPTVDSRCTIRATRGSDSLAFFPNRLVVRNGQNTAFDVQDTAFASYFAVDITNGGSTFGKPVISHIPLINAKFIQGTTTTGDLRRILGLSSDDNVYVGDVDVGANLHLRAGSFEGVRVGGALTVGFFGSAGTGRPTITGAKGGNAALASLLTALANLGLITDSTT